MDILDIAIAKQLAGGGGGSGTDNYNDLSNLPKINDVTLSGNKSSSALGLQSEITSENKLDSDLIDDTDQDNKFVTSSEKNIWNAKQNAIDADHKLNADYVDDSTSTNKFVTASDKETWNAKQNAIDNSHKLSSDLVDDTNHTNKFVTSTEKQTWNAKQNAIDADHKLSSSLVNFSDAEAAAIASGIDSSKVAQISTNQSNILYGLNTGVKNKLPCQISNDDQPNDTGLKSNYNEDGTYTVTGTKSTSDAYLDIKKIYADKLNGDHVAYISVTGTGTCQIAAYGWNGTGYTLMLTTSSSQSFNIGNYGHILFRIRFMDSVGTSYNATIKAMVCTLDAWNQSHDWQPPALPNYDLTRLEAEDRAALAEDIDSGAKNKFNPANIAELRNLATNGSDYAYVSTSTDTRTKCNFSVFSWNGNTKIDQLTKVDVTANGNIALIFTKQASYNKISFGHSGQAKDLMIFYNVSDLVNGQTYVLSVNITQFNPSVTNFAFSDVLLCTKAAFGVSQKFVAYRPDYDELMPKGKRIVATGSSSFTIEGTTHLVSIWVQITSNSFEYANYIMIKYTSANNVNLALLSKSTNADTYITVTTSGDTVTVDTSDKWKLVTINELT